MRGTAVAYQEVRARVLALVDAVDDPEQVVPCCPEWTIRQLYAHLAGVPADVLAGRVEGAATDPWTARQVEERDGHTFATIVEELRDLAPAFDETLAALGDALPPELVIDAWTHEQDLRHALGVPGGRAGAAVDFTSAALSRSFGQRLDEVALPAVVWDDGVAVRTLGASEPGVTLVCDTFGFLRARMGRRSRAQLRNLGWDTDPEPWLSVFPVFAPARHPVDEGTAPPHR